MLSGNAEDELRELARRARRMRQLQATYFRTRDADTLTACKRAEKDLDEAVARVLDGRTGDLFAAEPEAGQ